MTEYQEKDRSDQFLTEALRVNDGWGDWLKQSESADLNLEEFVGFVHFGLFNQDSDEPLVFVNEAGETGVTLPPGLVDLSRQEIDQAYGKFRFIKAFLDDDNKLLFWSKKMLAGKDKELSTDRLDQLLEGQKKLESGVTIGGEFSPSVLSALCIRGVISEFGPETERVKQQFLDCLLRELLDRDPLTVTANGDELRVAPSQGTLEISLSSGQTANGTRPEINQWVSSVNDNRCIVIFPFKARDKKGDNTHIGRCCFTVEMLGSGVESAKKQSFTKAADQALERVPLARVVYNQYDDPRLPGTVNFLIYNQAVSNGATTLALSKINR